MTAWQSYLDENQKAFLNELIEFLKIPSVSSLSEHAADVHQAGQWVADKLSGIGMDNVRVMETGGHPVVYADWLHADHKPTILIYGHFDTQPVDPLDDWHQPPFEPQVKDGRIYARGASDDKGGMLMPILALQALLAVEGKLPVNVKCLFEGQEEIGSPQLPAFIQEHVDLLKSDFLFSADGAQWAEDQPALILGTKGMCSLHIDVYGANSDLHSGVFGGAVQNPIHALVRLLDSMRAADGKITIDGFYGDVKPLSETERSEIAKVPFDESGYKAQLGLNELFGEPGYSTHERAWARPTLECNGIYGGFQGEGIKAVIPKSAHAKLTCRLVADQNPQTIIQRLQNHIADHTPPGVRIETRPGRSSAEPFLMDANHPGNQAAAYVLRELYGKTPYHTRIGGSLPICGLFQEHLGLDMVNFAFGLLDENIHAPNEFLRLKNFERGQRAYGLLLHHLGG